MLVTVSPLPGTAALEVAMAALGIGNGDEVIVPNFTFVATASAVLFANALPVLVEVDPKNYCLDPASTEAAITSRTKAIIAVHMGGHPADLDRLGELAKRHGIHLVEDSAHAHGVNGADGNRNVRHGRDLQFSGEQTHDSRRRRDDHL